jgi:hypothetical protein
MQPSEFTHRLVRMIRAVVIAVALTLLYGCSEPFIVFSGGELAGEIAPPPDDWAALAAEETFQLETRPQRPYSVNVWAVGIGPHVYIGTGPDGTRWSQYIARDPRVRLRVGETLFVLVAQPVTAPEERREVAIAYADKYGMNPRANWLGEALVWRLDRP